MKYFITGGAGQLGSALIDELSESDEDNFVCTFYNNLILNECKSHMVDITEDKIIKKICKEEPDVVIHTAAVTDVDLCEKNKELAYSVNVKGTRNVVEACKKIGAKLVFVSSTFVFDSSKKFHEDDDSLNPVNYYGRTKSMAEELVKGSGLDYIIVRPDQIFTWHSWTNNFVKKVLNKLDRGVSFSVFTDWINQPTYAPNLAKIILELVRGGESGVFNTTGSSVISRYDWACLIAEIFDKNSSLIKKGDSSSISLPAERPNCKVSTTKVKKITNPNMSLKKSLEHMKKMSESSIKKGVILAGGKGTRLSPATNVTNKHLLLVYDRPMIFYPLQRLISAGVKNILIVSGGEHLGDFIDLFGSGSRFGVNISYKVQDKAGGIAQAIGLAEDFVEDDDFVVILGDNYYEDGLKNNLKNFSEGARIILKPVDDPERYGVATIENNKIKNIVEKPENPESNLAVTGCYVYDNKVFDIIKSLNPSDRGELEITDVNNKYLDRGELDYSITNGFWTDMGKPGSLLKAANFIKEKVND